MKYLIVIEKTKTGFSAFSPDVFGCVTTGKTRKETLQNMREALAFHFDGLRIEDLPIPQPSSSSAYMEVAA